MERLDNPETHQMLDPSGLRNRLRQLPVQCQKAWDQAMAWSPPIEWLLNDIDRVVIGGMGGSAIAGDLAADLASVQHVTPISVVRDLHLPYKLDQRTLFIASSHSGNTEETLSLFNQALESGARVMAITGGGSLWAKSDSLGIPHLIMEAPGEPRSAVGYSLMLLLGALSRVGLLNIPQRDVTATVSALGEQITAVGEEVPASENAAKALAVELVNRIIVVYGGGIFTGLARRWKSQFNENSKAWAFYETIPELLHNSVESFRTSAETGQGDMGDRMVVVLKPATGTKELQGRYRVVLELLRQKDVPHRLLESESGSELAQLLSTLLLGDYVSYYLALLNGLNPSPNPAIDLGKQLLSESS